MKPAYIFRYVLLVALILLIQGQLVYGQISLPGSDSATAQKYFEEARQLVENGQYIDATSRIQAVLNISLSRDMHQQSARAYELLGNIAGELDDWENTLRYYLKAAAQYDTVKLFEEEAGIYSLLGDNYLSFGAFDLAARYHLLSYRLTSAQQTADKALRAENTAYAFKHSGQSDSALFWYSQAEKYYMTDTDLEGILRCLYGRAREYTSLSLYDSALNTYMDAGNLLSEGGSAAEKARLHNNIGYLWFRQKKYDFALEAFTKALNLQESEETLHCEQTTTLTNIAICLQNLKQRDEAMDYLFRAIENAAFCKQWNEKAAVEHTLALIYENQDDLYHAGYYCEECITSALKGAVPQRLQECYKTYSKLLEEGNDFIHALEYYEKHLNIRDSLLFIEKMDAQHVEQLHRSLEATEQKLRLSLADEEVKDLMLKNLQSQAENREKELRLITSQNELERSENKRLQQSMDLERERYQREMKEQEVKTLEQDKAYQNLLLIQKDNEEKALQRQNQLLEAEKETQRLEAEKEREAKKRATWTAALSILIILLVFASLVSARKRNAILKKQKQLIEEKNTDLAQKNEEIMTQNEQIVLQTSIIEQKNISITDSIQYASRIQKAVLPSIEFLGDMGLEHFIFFRPKDIVSGDFYWGDKKGDLLSFAAVDCTGHGVPGAFMSMLGSAFLNEISANDNVEDAAVLLNRLREQVIHALKQKGESGEAQDGMDIALCIYDSKTRKLSFSGANNPLYLVREGELHIYKGDKMPIGIHSAGEKSFSSYTLDIQKGDRVFLFSDGFADQFGGADGKKFKYKPFQELLVRIAAYPAQKQKEMLEEAFDQWKGLLEQVDDVLVIGVSF